MTIVQYEVQCSRIKNSFEDGFEMIVQYKIQPSRIKNMFGDGSANPAGQEWAGTTEDWAEEDASDLWRSDDSTSESSNKLVPFPWHSLI